VCKGDLGTYYVALASYIIILTIAAVVIAIKTRKLRHKNFKDTKMVNVFSDLSYTKYPMIWVYTSWLLQLCIFFTVLISVSALDFSLPQNFI